MKKLLQTTQTINLRNLLNSKLTVEQNENLHKELGVSKKLLTLLIREPARFKTYELKKLSELLRISIDEIISIIN
jgi:hypothetical protein